MKENQMPERIREACMLICFIISLTGCGLKFKPVQLFTDEQAPVEDSGKRSKKTVSISCWNVQTFFDAVTDGCEYSDFKNSSKWTKEKYVRRLEKLCEVMTMLNADITVLEEIENASVVQDIANRFTEGVWNKKKGWQYACFAKEEGSAIGCAVFSRYELTEMTVHSLDVRVHEIEQPSSRPIMQFTVSAGEKDIEVFVNHWKSKSGGKEETEIWRDWQEAVLAERLYRIYSYDEKLPCVICGDFNRSVEDFIPLKDDYSERNGRNLILRKPSDGYVEVFSPWFLEDGKFATEIGSYYYDGGWERIDNFFFAGNIAVNQFLPVTDSAIADEDSIPQGYKVYTDYGCSDHLPLKCIISF